MPQLRTLPPCPRRSRLRRPGRARPWSAPSSRGDAPPAKGATATRRPRRPAAGLSGQLHRQYRVHPHVFRERRSPQGRRRTDRRPMNRRYSSRPRMCRRRMRLPRKHLPQMRRRPARRLRPARRHPPRLQPRPRIRPRTRLQPRHRIRPRRRPQRQPRPQLERQATPSRLVSSTPLDSPLRWQPCSPDCVLPPKRRVRTDRSSPWATGLPCSSWAWACHSVTRSASAPMCRPR